MTSSCFVSCLCCQQQVDNHIANDEKLNCFEIKKVSLSQESQDSSISFIVHRKTSSTKELQAKSCSTTLVQWKYNLDLDVPLPYFPLFTLFSSPSMCIISIQVTHSHTDSHTVLLTCILQLLAFTHCFKETLMSSLDHYVETRFFQKYPQNTGMGRSWRHRLQHPLYKCTNESWTWTCCFPQVLDKD